MKRSVKFSVKVLVAKVSMPMALVAAAVSLVSARANAQMSATQETTYWVVVERTDMQGFSPISQVLLSEDGGQTFEPLKIKDCGRVYLTGDSTVSCDFAGAGWLLKSAGNWNGQEKSELWQVKLYSAVLRAGSEVSAGKSISMLGFPE